MNIPRVRAESTVRASKSDTPRLAKNWEAFDRLIRANGYPLLRSLDCFADPILIAGCQRSGTTMLADVINRSDQIRNPWSPRNSELEAANVMAGSKIIDFDGRYCFQTTYINDRMEEYLEHPHYRLIWVLRNPNSVVHSMLYNWRSPALRRLFRTCGYSALPNQELTRYHRYGCWFFTKLDQACYSYAAKVSQARVLMNHLGPGRMLTIDYDQLVVNLDRSFSRVFEFLTLPYNPEYSVLVHKSSRTKSMALNERACRRIDAICGGVYQNTLGLVGHEQN